MKCNTVTVVDACAGDAQQIAELSNSAIEKGLVIRWSPSRVIKAINSPRTRVLVARTHTEFAGFGIMDFHKKRANLSLLAIEEQFRGKGLGSEIVTTLQNVALRNDIENIYVQVRQRNTGAIGFYESLGFEMIDLSRRYYQGKENAVVMYSYMQSDALVGTQD